MLVKLLRFIPDTIIIVLFFLLLMIALTWMLPAGEYTREQKNNREMVVDGSYREVPSNPQGISDFLTAPIKGFISASQIVGFVFLVGGAFGIINRSGAINEGLKSLIRSTGNSHMSKKIIIPVVMTLFSLAGATFGMSEEVMVFILITIPMALALGYDSLVGVAIPFIGAGVGFAGAFSNPFTIGVAQEIAGIQLFSGWGYRLVVWAVLTTIAIIYVMVYAGKISAQKIISSVSSIDQTRESIQDNREGHFTIRHKIILTLLFSGIVFLVVGVSIWDWYINQISGLFIALGILTAFIAGIGSKSAVDAFLSGAKDMMIAAMVIALTRGILIIATEGKIIDTVLHVFSGMAEGLPSGLSVQIMFFFQGFINFFVPSGSGQAALTMPIMSPLGDLLGISRQTAVLAFQLGDGLFNLVIPTSGVTMGILGIAKIPFSTWLKWMMPLMLFLVLAAMVLLLPPVLYFHWN